MKSFKQYLDEAGNSMQGTILQAVGMIDNSRYIKKGSVVGNNKLSVKPMKF